MSPKQFVAALVIVGMMGATARAYAQMPPPAPPQQQPAPYPPPGYPPPGYPPPGYPGQYQQPLNPGPQPPASAVAPNGEYVAPLSQTTQPTYVPQSVALSGPRFIKDWEPGQPVPYGYHEEERVRKGLVISGAVVGGVLYIISTMIASLGADIASSNGGDNKTAWLYLPVLGPFLEMSETGGSSSANEFLVLDGLAQAAGVTMLIAGIMYPKHLLVRNDLATVGVLPMKIGMEGEGLGLVGRF